MATKVIQDPENKLWYIQAECDVCASEEVFLPEENGEAYCFEHLPKYRILSHNMPKPRKWWLKIDTPSEVIQQIH